MTALILVNTIKVQELYFSNIYEYFILVLKEFWWNYLRLCGIYDFHGYYVAGQFIDMQIGFGVVNVIDPLNSTQVSITSNFYFLLCMLVFLICRGHYILIRALFASYNYIPVGTVCLERIW